MYHEGRTRRVYHLTLTSQISDNPPGQFILHKGYEYQGIKWVGALRIDMEASPASARQLIDENDSVDNFRIQTTDDNIPMSFFVQVDAGRLGVGFVSDMENVGYNVASVSVDSRTTTVHFSPL